MADLALVTANFGGIDDVKPLPRHDGIDAFYYTDEETRALIPPTVVPTWNALLVPGYPRHDFGPRLRSRYFKHQIHRLDEVRAHRWLVWADASLQFHELAFVLAEAARLAALPPEQRVLVVPHPDRRTIRQEYEFIRGQIDQGNEYLRARYSREKMTEQMAHFQQHGWSLEERLYCGGFWMVENCDRMHRCWGDWWDQNLRFGMMDQLSLPAMLANHGYQPQILDVKIARNAHFSFVEHRRVG